LEKPFRCGRFTKRYSRARPESVVVWVPRPLRICPIIGLGQDFRTVTVPLDRRPALPFVWRRIDEPGRDHF